jgi:LysM repeat protein
LSKFQICLRLFGLLLAGALALSAAVSGAQAQDPRSELIAVINSLRASYGLPPYSVDPELMAMAQEHSAYQASIHRGTHQHSDGRVPADLGVIENVAGGTLGYVTPQIVVYNIWADPGHLHTMIGYPGGAMGVGVADDGETAYYTLEVRPAGQAFSSPQAAGSAQPRFTPIPLVAVATVTPRPDGSIFHPIGYGQSLWALAQAYDVTVDQLRAWNNIPAESNEIFAGQQLLVRPAGYAQTVPTNHTEISVEQVSATALAFSASNTALLTQTATPVPASTVPPASHTPTPTLPVRINPPASGISIPIAGGLFILAAILLVLAARMTGRK